MDHETTWKETVADLRGATHDRIEWDGDDGKLVGPGGTELVDGHGQHPDDVTWIDRRSRWGNPFRLGDGYGRAEAVGLYRGWFHGHVERGEWDPDVLRGETLACWCVPRLCHGIVICNYLAETFDPQATLETAGGSN